MRASPVTSSAADRLRLAIEAHSRAEAAEARALVDFAAEHEWPLDAEIDLIGQRPARIGADGTPLLDEYVALEVAALKGISVAAATWLIRDVVNLRFRHPRLWARALSADLPLYRACQLAAEAARFELTAEQAHLVDDELAPQIGRLPWRRLLTLYRGLIADQVPGKLEELAARARSERFVRRLGTDDPSVDYLSARVDTADARYFDAIVDQIADLLQAQGDTDTKGVRRAKSIGILATPARATLLLAQAAGQEFSDLDDPTPAPSPKPGDAASESTQPQLLDDQVRHPAPSAEQLEQRLAEADWHDAWASGGTATTGGAAATGSTSDPDPRPTLTPAELERRLAEAEADAAATGELPITPVGLGAFRQVPPAALSAIRWTDPRLLPKCCIYLHLAEDTVLHGRGPARAENIGPITAAMLGLLVGHSRIELTPVVRPYDTEAVDAYEIPRRIREQVILRDAVEVFPFSARSARTSQHDHTIPYRPGVPKQTRTDNLGALATKPHRGKTHGHWQLKQPTSGIFWWTTPAGNQYRVTRGSTMRLRSDTPLDRAVANAIRHHDEGARPEPAGPVEGPRPSNPGGRSRPGSRRRRRRGRRRAGNRPTSKRG